MRPTLTDVEMAQIAHLKSDKRRAAQAYLINGTRGRGTVSVRLGPRAYWICTSDPIGDVPEREAALRRSVTKTPGRPVSPRPRR